MTGERIKPSDPQLPTTPRWDIHMAPDRPNIIVVENKEIELTQNESALATYLLANPDIFHSVKQLDGVVFHKYVDWARLRRSLEKQLNSTGNRVFFQVGATHHLRFGLVTQKDVSALLTNLIPDPSLTGSKQPTGQLFSFFIAKLEQELETNLTSDIIQELYDQFEHPTPADIDQYCDELVTKLSSSVPSGDEKEHQKKRIKLMTTLPEFADELVERAIADFNDPEASLRDKRERILILLKTDDSAYMDFEPRARVRAFYEAAPFSDRSDTRTTMMARNLLAYAKRNLPDLTAKYPTLLQSTLRLALVDTLIVNPDNTEPLLSEALEFAQQDQVTLLPSGNPIRAAIRADAYVYNAAVAEQLLADARSKASEFIKQYILGGVQVVEDEVFEHLLAFTLTDPLMPLEKRFPPLIKNKHSPSQLAALLENAFPDFPMHD